jgi:hypothetical protein
MRPLIPLRLRLVCEPIFWAIAFGAAVLLCGCDAPSQPSAPAPSQAATAPTAPPPPAPPAAGSWLDQVLQQGGTVEFTRSYDGGGTSSTKAAEGVGPGFRGTGDNVDVSKFNGSAPTASAGEQPGAQGGGVSTGFKVWTDSGRTAVRIVLALLGAIGIGYAAWLLKTKAAIKDAAIAGAVGVAFIAAAIEPAIVLYALGAAVAVLLLRFGPLALQARAYEPARAVIDGIATVEKRATQMPDDGQPIAFKSTREYMLAALKLMKSEIASQQTGNDREITRDIKSPDLP